MKKLVIVLFVSLTLSSCTAFDFVKENKFSKDDINGMFEKVEDATSDIKDKADRLNKELFK